MPDPSDPVLTSALHLVLDEAVAKRSAPDIAQAIRQHAAAHAVGVLTLAVDGNRASVGATALPDGRVVLVAEIWPRNQE